MQQIFTLLATLIAFAPFGIRENSFSDGDIYVGPGSDTLYIDEDFIQDGNIIIYGDGVLLVDNAKLTISQGVILSCHGSKPVTVP